MFQLVRLYIVLTFLFVSCGLSANDEPTSEFIESDLSCEGGKVIRIEFPDEYYGAELVGFGAQVIGDDDELIFVDRGAVSPVEYCIGDRFVKHLRISIGYGDRNPCGIYEYDFSASLDTKFQFTKSGYGRDI